MLNLFIDDMYNKYTCPIQAQRHLTLKLFIQGHLQRTKVPHVVNFKNVNISLVIGHRVLGCETNL